MATPKRLPGRPVGSGDPDATVAKSIRLRPSEVSALAAKHPKGWRARVAELIAADLT